MTLNHISCLILSVALGVQASHAALIAYYDMEQATSPLVDQAGGETAAATGSGHAYSQAGPAGWGNSVRLSANGSWQLDAADSAELRALSNNFTVASWIYVEPGRFGKFYGGTSSNARFDRIIGDDVAWDRDGWSFGIENRSATDRTIVFTKNGITNGESAVTTSITEGAWHHVAVTVSSTTGITYFIDGVQFDTNNNTANLFTGTGNNGQDDPYAIGRSYGADAAQNQWFAGNLDEVRVYDSILSSTEIAVLAVPEPGTLALAAVGLAGSLWYLRGRRVAMRP